MVDRSNKQQQHPPNCFQFDLPKPSSGGKLPAPSPPVSAGGSGSNNGPGPGGFRFSTQPSHRAPTLPPRPPPSGAQIGYSPDQDIQPPPGKVFMTTNSGHPSRLTNPPTDLPGLPPRPPPTGSNSAESGVDRSSSSSVARLAQMFGSQLSPNKYGCSIYISLEFN